MQVKHSFGEFLNKFDVQGRRALIVHSACGVCVHIVCMHWPSKRDNQSILMYDWIYGYISQGPYEDLKWNHMAICSTTPKYQDMKLWHKGLAGSAPQDREGTSKHWKIIL